MFQCPYLPEVWFRADDFKQLGLWLRSFNEGGIVNSQNFTNDDLEAWKYTFEKKGNFR
jgi:hypothetical protein